jgi:hypothetical protein
VSANHAIVETGHDRESGTAVCNRRDGLDAAKIVGSLIPDSEIEQEPAAAREFVQLAVQAEPELGDTRSEMRCREEKGVTNSNGRGRIERRAAGLFSAKITGTIRPPMLCATTSTSGTGCPSSNLPYPSYYRRAAHQQGSSRGTSLGSRKFSRLPLEVSGDTLATLCQERLPLSLDFPAPQP